MEFGLRKKFNGAIWRTRNQLGSIGDKLRVAFGRPGARVNAAFHHPTDMCEADRIFLYAFVRSTAPLNALEVGSRWGGSAQIIAAAMDDNGRGRVVGIDPEPQAFIASTRCVQKRFELVQGYSPQDIPKAVKRLGGSVDFLFVDAMHTRDSCLADVLAVVPYLQDGAYVVLHDAFHLGIDDAARTALAQVRDFQDLGILSRHPKPGGPVCYQGMRILRYGGTAHTDLLAGYAQSGVEMPAATERYYNYDAFAIRSGMVVDMDGVFTWKSSPLSQLPPLANAPKTRDQDLSQPAEPPLTGS